MRTALLDHFVDLSTPAKRLEALESIPQIAKYAAEGNPFYIGLLAALTYSLAFRAMCPWMWGRNDPA